MKDLNQVIIIGRLVRDPELKYLSSGKAVCNFSIASNSGTKDKPTVNFLDIQCWEKLAENVVKFMKKGNQVSVNGELMQQRWDKDGKTQSKIIINAHEIQFLSNNKAPESNNPEMPIDHNFNNPWQSDDNIQF